MASASNTGLKSGACTFMEHSLDHEMAWVACRHHIMELVLASIFQALFGPTGGPDVALFKSFQTTWPYIDQSAYETASDDMFDSCTKPIRNYPPHQKICSCQKKTGDYRQRSYEETK